MKRLAISVVLLFTATKLALACSTVTLPPQVQRNFTIVLGHSGKALGGISVTVTAVDGSRAARQVTTDKHGRAEILGLEPGKYIVKSIVSEDELTVVGSGGTEMVEISAPYDREPVEIAAVNGVISDPTGARVQGAVAVLEQLDAARSPVAATTTGASGGISLAAPAGVYLLRVASPGFVTAVLPVRIAPHAGPVTFTLALGLGGCPQFGAPFTFSLER